MRTDRTFVCVACRTRSWPVRRCPSCGESHALGDLEMTPRRDLEAKLGVRAGGAGAIRVGAGLTSVVAALACSVAFSAGNVGLAEGLLLVAIPSVLIAAVGRRREPPPRTPYRVLDSPVVRAAAVRVTKRGTVRARQTLTSPIAKKACVAWRLAGDPEAEMPLDDGRAVAFTLLAGGEEIDVEADVATLELTLPERPRARPVDAELVRWLAARGIEAGTEIVAREATLADGDEVEVVGTAREEARADGYRGHATRLVLADVPGSPLIVRSPAA